MSTPTENSRLSVAVSGAGGLVGSALVDALVAAGHRVRRMVRRRNPADRESVYYDPATGDIESGKLAGLDAVVHLAGENIAAGRWSPRQKGRIRDSRIHGAGLVARTLAGLERGPRTLISASAIGFYGDRGEEPLDESAPGGAGFLAETCRLWEAATEPAASAGLRVVLPRIGVVLSAKGGALKRMLPPFRLGLGGPIGDGRQFMSWIGLHDLIRVLIFALERDDLAGPLNAVSPSPVTNREWTRVLAGVLRRPALLPLPAPVVRLGMGEMGRELLLAGARILPQRLLEAGFDFRHPDLESALRFELGCSVEVR